MVQKEICLEAYKVLSKEGTTAGGVGKMRWRQVLDLKTANISAPRSSHWTVHRGGHTATSHSDVFPSEFFLMSTLNLFYKTKPISSFFSGGE